MGAQPATIPHLSYLHVDAPPTISVDAGSLWTAAVARAGSDAVDGFTVGLFPGETLSDADRRALDLDDFAMWRGYYDRVYAAIDELWDRTFAGEPAVYMVVEEFTMPRKGNGRNQRWIPAVDWVPTRELNAGVAARYPGTESVNGRGGLGGRHQVDRGGNGDWQAYYPQALYRGRPDWWMPTQHPKRVRNHEQSAFDAAGLAHLLRTGLAWYEETDDGLVVLRFADSLLADERFAA